MIKEIAGSNGIVHLIESGVMMEAIAYIAAVINKPEMIRNPSVLLLRSANAAKEKTNTIKSGMPRFSRKDPLTWANLCNSATYNRHSEVPEECKTLTVCALISPV
jgi:hypothetical protein